MAYVVGIGGVRATGKSTLARNLGLILRADIISSGRTREMLRAQATPDTQPALFASITAAPTRDDSVQLLRSQAKTLKPSLAAAIAQCREREANLIIEGAHLVPGIYTDLFDTFVILVAPPEKIEYRLHKDKKRRSTDAAFTRSVELQEYLKNEAQQYRVPLIDTTSLPKALIEIVRLLPMDKLPATYFE